MEIKIRPKVFIKNKRVLKLFFLVKFDILVNKFWTIQVDVEQLFIVPIILYPVT
jgi:hypothetical protein